LPAELQESFNRLYLVDFGERIEDSEWVEKEIKKTKTQIAILQSKEDLQTLWQKIRTKEGEESEEISDGDKKKILLLTQKLSELEKGNL